MTLLLGEVSHIDLFLVDNCELKLFLCFNKLDILKTILFYKRQTTRTAP